MFTKHEVAGEIIIMIPRYPGARNDDIETRLRKVVIKSRRIVQIAIFHHQE